MKVGINERTGIIEISLEAESKEDVVQLVRLGMNSTKQLKLCRTEVYKSGGVHTYIHVGHHRRSDGTVPKRR